jgi:uncharacterized protein/uncharacterized tellurite resistance protein B-like protein
MAKTRIWVMCAVVLLTGLPVISYAASFNCAKATSPNELMICADRQLSVMDDDLASLYRAAKAATQDAVAFKKETNDEWRKRERCADRDCIVAWYQRRSSQLATVLNHAQIKEAPTKPATAPVPVLAAPAADDSTGFSGFLWLIGGLFVLVWVIKQLGAAGRRQVATARAAAAAKTGPVTTGQARPDSGITVTIRRQGPTKKSSQTKRSGRGVQTVWISAGQTTLVKALSIPGGMLYVGSALTAPDGSIEPAQIDPTLEVDSQAADPQERLFGYWPRYDDISPTARRAYLTWLAGGRLDPSADVGYVFLFFYGLERRVLVDAKTDATARAEVPAIVAEVERLRAIYGNRSFQSYTKSFLEYVVASGAFEKTLYLREPPPATANREMPLLLRAGLGQCALDGAPVPAAWALCWARSEPNVSMPRVAGRCQSQFDRQFKRIYRERFANGLRLSVNRTKLKVSYRAASGGLQSESFSSDFGELPDVTTVVTPLKKLQGVMDEAAAGLEAYSRFIGRHGDKAESLEATVLLPKELWSAAVKEAVSALDARVGAGMVVIRLGELLSAFGGAAAPSREILKNLFGVLRSQSIGVEPDVLSGAKTPKADDSVVLFRFAANEAPLSSAAESAYAAVAVMLDLAITLANADGKISGREVQFLNRQVDGWSHVGESAQRRLRARLRLGIVYPPTLASLKSRIEPLPTAAREALAKLLSALAMADGKLDAAAVKHLEKVYALLGIEGTALYSELHGVAAEADRRRGSPSATSLAQTQAPSASSAASSNQAPTQGTATGKAATKFGGMQLDPARIATLQMESERVTALLSKVFEEEAPAVPIESVSAKDAGPESSARAPRLLGMDGEHSAFLRVLLTRHSWSRAELNDIAADMEMMLDGALERVNEAALEMFDARIAEGDDPIEIERDLMESVNA